MKGSSDSTSSGSCLSVILRRFRCSGSIPSDHEFLDLNQDSGPTILELGLFDSYQARTEVKKEASPGPGVVARLMGLDSFDHHQQHKSLGSYLIRRSKSANSIDFLSFLDHPIRFNKQVISHRRVRTCVSFREEEEDDDKFCVVFPLEEEILDDESAEHRILVMRRRARADDDDVNYYYYQTKEHQKMKNKEIVGVIKRPPAAGRKVVLVKRSSVTNKILTINDHEKKNFHVKAAGSLDLKASRRIRTRVITYKPATDHFKQLRSRPPIISKKIHHESTRKVSLKMPSRPNKHGTISEKPNFQRTYSTTSGTGPLSENGSEIRPNIKLGHIEEERKLRKEYKRLTEEIRRLTDLVEVATDGINGSCDYWMYGQILKLEDFEFEDVCLLFVQHVLDLLLNQIVDELVLLYNDATTN